MDDNQRAREALKDMFPRHAEAISECSRSDGSRLSWEEFDDLKPSGVKKFLEQVAVYDTFTRNGPDVPWTRVTKAVQKLRRNNISISMSYEKRTLLDHLIDLRLIRL